MCGRARLSSDVSEIKIIFSIPPHRPTPNIAPSWNVAPTDPLPIVRYDPKAALRDCLGRSAANGPGGAVGKLALGGGREGGQFAIITTTPNEQCVDSRVRTPVVLKPRS
jgi:putative SOS response-associated peptidase YedK